jgi:hypothetical protein
MALRISADTAASAGDDETESGDSRSVLVVSRFSRDSRRLFSCSTAALCWTKRALWRLWTGTHSELEATHLLHEGLALSHLS